MEPRSCAQKVLKVTIMWAWGGGKTANRHAEESYRTSAWRKRESPSCHLGFHL
jgi:hypothetical protein